MQFSVKLIWAEMQEHGTINAISSR